MSPGGRHTKSKLAVPEQVSRIIVVSSSHACRAELSQTVKFNDVQSDINCAYTHGSQKRVCQRWQLAAGV